MALNPRIVLEDVDVIWDGGGVTPVPAGTIIDCAPGSPLETAYGGSSNLRPFVDGEQAYTAN
jgi:hypothetical protein